MIEEKVILVDDQDRETGTCEKMEAHGLGMLHRAVSVFVFNSSNQLLLQKRSESKYHSSNLWTNTCCTHPRPGELTENAASRRLKEEMGIEVSLEKAFQILYRKTVGTGLIEHEFDHVFIGWSDQVPNPDPLEASSWRYVSIAEVQEEVSADALAFTAWFPLLLPGIIDSIKKKSEISIL